MIATLYFLCLVLNLLAHLLGFSTLTIVSKVLLMPFLFGYAQMNWPKHYWLISALFFSWLGDLFLLGSGQRFFILGLASFLIAHLMYLKILTKRLQINWLKSLLCIAYAGLFLKFYLLHHLPADLKIPVMVYISVIILMAIAAVNQKEAHEKHNLYVAIGAVLFVLSDSIIAVNTFVEPIKEAGFWVMLTYGLAQFLLIHGITKKRPLNERSL